MFDFLSIKQESNKSSSNSVDASSNLQKVPTAPDIIYTEKKNLEDKIFSLYRIAWLGIYQVHDDRGRDHATRLAELFFGAGMSSYVDKSEEDFNNRHGNNPRRYTGAESRVLKPLWLRLQKNGLKRLKLFEGISVMSLEAVIELLEAYVKEVTTVNGLYHLLRELQVGFRTPTEDDEQAVLEQFIPIANQFAKRLLHLDAKLDVLVSDMEDEFWNEYGAVQGREGWFVHYAVFRSFPPRGKKMSLMSSMKS
jgi:hypothetical protein